MAGTGGTTPRVPATQLPVGVWTNITPVEAGAERWSSENQCRNGPDTTCTYGTWIIAVSPHDPNVLYVTIDQLGLWRSLDAGATFTRLGDPRGTINESSATYLDSPTAIAIDPADPLHLYATQGVRGVTLGFWVSRDGGETWTKPKGFRDVAAMVGGSGANDVTALAVNPDDFDHILVSSHNDWSITPGTSGIVESEDGGETFRYHRPPAEGWSRGTKSVSFLMDTDTNLGLGDRHTWLIGDEGGLFRTTDAGANWKRVSQSGMMHGAIGSPIRYTADGTLYVAVNTGLLRSDDNGDTWESVPGVPGREYMVVGGDGERLYVHDFNLGTTGTPYFSANESGGDWKEERAAGLVRGFPATMVFEPVNRVLYSANAVGGLWALRIAE